MERGVLSERASDSFRCAAVTDPSLSLSLSRSSEQNLRQGRVKNVRRTPGLPPITPPISKQQQPPPSSSSSGVGHGHGAMDYPRDFEVDVNQYRPPSATFQQQLHHFHPTPSPQPCPLRSQPEYPRSFYSQQTYDYHGYPPASPYPPTSDAYQGRFTQRHASAPLGPAPPSSSSASSASGLPSPGSTDSSQPLPQPR